MPVNYDKWGTIEVSDDEDLYHPNVDQQSLWKWSKEAREIRDEKEAAHEREIAELHKRTAAMVAEFDAKIEAAATEEEKEKLRQQAHDMQAQAEKFAQKERELREKKIKYPRWNSRTLCQDGAISKTVINKYDSSDPALKAPEMDTSLPEEEAKADFERKLDEWAKAMDGLVSDFGQLASLKDSYDFISKHPAILADECADALCLMAVDAYVRKYYEVMKDDGTVDATQVNADPKCEGRRFLFQSLVLSYCIDLTKAGNGKDGVILFFKRMHAQDNEHRETFQKDLERMQQTAQRQAKERLDRAVEEARARHKAEAEAELARFQRNMRLLLVVLTVLVVIVAVVIAQQYS